MSILTVILLYIAFRIKHVVCDFILQTNWMAMTKGKPGLEGYKALALHIVSHTVVTLIIMLIFAPALWWLAIVDFLVHGAIDRIKGVLTCKFNWKPSDRWFWWSLGLDQEAHNFTHLAFIIYIVSASGGIVL